MSINHRRTFNGIFGPAFLYRNSHPLSSRTPLFYPYPVGPTILRSLDETETGTGCPPYLALARGTLVMGILPGAAAFVDDPGIAAWSRSRQNRERGAISW